MRFGSTHQNDYWERQLFQDINPSRVRVQINCPNDMRNFLTAIVDEVIGTINADKNLHPARMLMFNQAAEGDGNNRYLPELIEGASEVLSAVRRAINDDRQFEQEAGTWIQEYLAACAAKLVQRDVQLQNLYDRNQLITLERAYVDFEQKMSQLTAQANRFGGPAWRSTNRRNEDTFQLKAPSWAKSSTSQSQESSAPSWSQKKRKEEPAPQTPAKKEKESQFRRSENMPHPYAFDPNLGNLTYGIGKAGVLTAIHEQYDNMDKNLHLALPSYGAEWQVRRTVAAVETAMGRNDEMIAAAKFHQPATILMNPSIPTVYAALERLRQENASPSCVVGNAVDFYVPVELTGPHADVSALLARARKASGHEMLAKVLEADVSLNAADMTMQSVLGVIIRRLTAGVNDWLRNRATLEDLKISNYCTDAGALVSYIRDNYEGGKAGPVTKAYEESFQDIVEAALQEATEPELQQAIASSFYDEEELGEKKSFLYDYYRVIGLNMTSSELRLEMSHDCANVLTESTCPTAYGILTKMLEEHSTAPKHTVLILRTSDGAMLKISDSAFVSKTKTFGVFTTF